MAKTEVLQLYTAATTTTAGTISLDIPYSGTVVACVIDIVGTASAVANSWIRASVSKNATDNAAVNNAKNELFGGSSSANVASSSFSSTTAVQGVAVPLRAGERLYLNVYHSSTAPTLSNVRAMLHFAS